MLITSSMFARTWQVPTEVPTIKQAVEDSAAYGDTVLVAPGNYDTASGESFPINMTSGITLTSESGAPLTTIDANTTGSVISCINCDQSTEINGFTITGGYAPDGGGIYCYQSYLTIRDNIIRHNTATSITGGGGGIYCSNSEPTITHNLIIENASLLCFGGGIYCYFCYALIERNTVAYNTSRWGGGIFNDNSSPVIQYNMIKGNHSEWSGGGLDCYTNSSPDVTRNVIVGNSSGTDGAGIACCYSSAPNIQHNTIACNVGNFGGGVRSLGGSAPTVIANIIVDNVDALYLNYDSGVMLANENNIYCNSYQPDDYEVINNTNTTINITNNFWWETDVPSIGSLIYGPANFEPFHTIPVSTTPNEPSAITSIMAMTDSTYATPLASNLQIGDTLYVQLTGTDWHSGFIEPALVILKTTLDPFGIAVALIETDTATGIYQGRAHVSTASDDALNHIGANQDDTLFIVSHIDSTKRDTVFIGNIGIREHQTSPVRGGTRPTTIISGSINLPNAREYRIYDITGRIVQPQALRQGIYFLAIDGAIVSKVVKVR
ncbi:MAG: DUF1565 domain-containing protein [candidate division WOR-3 bacterium]